MADVRPHREGWLEFKYPAFHIQEQFEEELKGYSVDQLASSINTYYENGGDSGCSNSGPLIDELWECNLASKVMAKQMERP